MLIIKTDNGLVIITGCVPGVVNIAQKATEVAGGKIYIVLGGFHLGGASAPKIESIIYGFEQLSMEKVAPCHCSGDRARRLSQGIMAKITLSLGWDTYQLGLVR